MVNATLDPNEERRDVNILHSREALEREMEKDRIFREAMKENSNMAGLMSVLTKLDKEMSIIVRDTKLSPEDKLDSLRKLGMDRSNFAASKNNVLVAKFQSIMSVITQTAATTVESKLDQFRAGLDKVNSSKHYFAGKKELTELVKERVALLARLSETTSAISNIYILMESSSAEIIKSMPQGLPSENEYINGLLSSQKDLFIPANFELLADTIQRDLAENRIQLSSIIDKVNEFMRVVGELYNLDAKIINKANEVNLLLESNNVEDVIVPENLLQTAIRCYVGPSGIGTGATTLTRAGALARRGNSVLIDFREESSLSNYVDQIMELDEFLTNDVERPFLVVKGKVGFDSERMEEIVTQLLPKLNYYRYINILIDESQIPLFNAIRKFVLSIFFITDSTPRSIEVVRNAVENAELDEKIAKNIVIIDAAIDPMEMMMKVVKDPFVYKLISIPYMREMRACTLNGDRPYTIPSILEVYEEAFR